MTAELDIGTVTTPVASSTVSLEAEAMLSTKMGSWNKIVPGGVDPWKSRVTALPDDDIEMSTLCPFKVGKLSIVIASPG